MRAESQSPSTPLSSPPFSAPALPAPHIVLGEYISGLESRVRSNRRMQTYAFDPECAAFTIQKRMRPSSIVRTHARAMHAPCEHLHTGTVYM